MYTMHSSISKTRHFLTMNESYVVIIWKNHTIIGMSATAWKCFRCDLTFKEESHAILHEDLENHSTRIIKMAMA